MSTETIRQFAASDAPWLVAQHRALYARDEGFDQTFGDLVAEILETFIRTHDPSCERGWIAMDNTERLGSIFCVRLTDKTAKLRLFLLTPDARGRGLGQKMLTECMTFARRSGYSEMQLWTHESHRAACALYARSGWQLVDSKPVRSFGVDLVEQSWRIDL